MGGRSGVSVAAAMRRAFSIGGALDVTDRLKVAGSAGNAATVRQASAQLMPNDLAGQQGHFGACPSWLIDE